MPKEVPLEKINDSGKRSNTKFKRIKTLLKKCKELSNLCELDVDLLIYDNKQNLLTEYSSKPERDIYFFIDMLKRTTKNKFAESIRAQICQEARDQLNPAMTSNSFAQNMFLEQTTNQHWSANTCYPAWDTGGIASPET